MIKFGPYIEKKQAKSMGLLYYMTGRLCKNGHVDKKLVSSNKCMTCQNLFGRTDKRRAYEAAWKRKRRKCPEFIMEEKEARERWLSKDGVREEIYRKTAEYNRNRYATDPEFRERKNEAGKIWSKNNPDKVRDKSLRWVRRNPEKVRMANQERRVHREITQGRSAGVDLGKLFRENLGFCPYCSKCLFEGYHLDHILPISLGGGNEEANLQCICASCNLKKGAKHPDDWHGEIGWHTAAIRG